MTSVYVSLALAMTMMVVASFWAIYFGPLLRGDAERPWLFHLHGAVFLGWMGLLVTQATLVSLGRTRLHRRVGTFRGRNGTKLFDPGCGGHRGRSTERGVRRRTVVDAHLAERDGVALSGPGARIGQSAAVGASVRARAVLRWHRSLPVPGGLRLRGRSAGRLRSERRRRRLRRHLRARAGTTAGRSPGAANGRAAG